MVKGYRTTIHRASTWLLAFVVLALTLPAYGLPTYEQANPPEFDVDVVSARDDGSPARTRVDVYTRVAYSRLQFINTPNGFTAEYEVTAAFYEADERGRRQNLAQSKVWDATVRTATYAATRSAELHDRAMQSVTLRPGRYLLEMQIADAQSARTFTRTIPVVVRDLSRPVALGDLILIEDYDAERNAITPLVSNRLGTSQPRLKLFYELYTERPTRVLVTREIVRTTQGSLAPSMRSIFGLGRQDGIDEVVYTDAEARQVRGGRTQAVTELPLGDLKAGDYVVRIRVENEAGRVLDEAERLVALEWSGLADHIKDLDRAIAQLQPIAKSRELAEIKSGATQADRFERFLAFWEKRDPTPGTERNELMEEYYYRVDYANQKYGNLGEGWQTDQGQVMIIHGEPDAVERHPYTFGDSKAYEVWYYYRKGRRYIFIDRTGLGDFELKVPIWDESTRIR